VGDEVSDVVGPLGNPTHIEKVGAVLCAGGGVGIRAFAAYCRGLYIMPVTKSFPFLLPGPKNC